MSRPAWIAYAFRMSLNLNIRALRKARGLTIAQLAELVGVSVPHISEVERGKKNLNNHLMTRISAALGVQPEALIASEGDHLGKILTILGNLQDDDRKRVEDFAAALLQSEQAPRHTQ